MKGSPSKSEELKEKGNQCLKEEKYAEAILHYTHAISNDRENSILYSNRSMAFLKMDQFYLAYEDAKETIRLSPEWAKGYYRKAEVEFKAEHYREAMESFRKSLQFGADEPKVLDQLRKAKRELERQIRVDNQIPWVGAATGFVIGVLLVVFDVGIREQPFLVNPLWMTLVVMAASMVCYSLARFHKHTLQSQRKSLLEPPLDIFGMTSEKEEKKAPSGSGDAPQEEAKSKTS
ncbi:uncharacterized protein LOC119388166 [Rhipicephalus sanguineus]|uniref:uncharacterized protein LOC119388166 n=1 Tax=Rhipicephalus sanguineus TaxID=34632 RepID=UPI0018959D07|nr:uncharacterized protein LOC119388166 [Rhipicephalus sanguineus]